MIFNTILHAGSQPTSPRQGADKINLPLMFLWKCHIQDVMFSLLFASDKKTFFLNNVIDKIR